MAMLFDVAGAMFAIGGALEGDDAEALTASDLLQIRTILDFAYRGATFPHYPTVLEASALVLTRALRGRVARLRREECAVAFAVAFAEHHGVDLKMRPYRNVRPVLHRVRDGELGQKELVRWLRSRVTTDAAETLLYTPPGSAPLQRVVFAVGHQVNNAQPIVKERNLKMRAAIRDTLQAEGAHVFVPNPMEDDPNRTLDTVCAEIRSREDQLSALVVIGDHISAGCSQEIKRALLLRSTVLILQRTDSRSLQLRDSRINVLAHGGNLAAVPELVRNWFVEHHWELMNNERHRNDREALHLTRRVSLLHEWCKLTPTEQDDLCDVLRLDRRYVHGMLASGSGIESAGVGELESLHGALNVPLPGPAAPAHEFDDEELEALGAVCEELCVSPADGLRAASLLLIEVSVDGDRRGRATREIWRELLVRVGVVPQAASRG